MPAKQWTSAWQSLNTDAGEMRKTLSGKGLVMLLRTKMLIN